MTCIHQFQFNPFGENCYVLYDEASRDAFVVDPGMMIEAERIEMAEWLAAEQLTPRRVLLTHCHIDHVADARRFADLWHIPVCASADDRPLAMSLNAQAERFGFNRRYFSFDALEFDEILSDNQTLTLGDAELKVIATPGHSPGGLSFYIPSINTVLTGDTLFEGSVGRVDLPGGDMDTLLDSICKRLLTLPPATRVLSGHGYATTIGDEAASNPYIIY